MTYLEPIGGAPGPAHGAPGDAPNVLRHYWAVLRRRWKWIILGILVGLAAGYASTLLMKETRDPTSYYKATHTLTVDGSGTSSANPPNLQQTAFQVHSAAVVQRVADALGLPTETVNNQVSALARTDVLAIDVTGISTDPGQAVQLADTAASVLNQSVSGGSEAEYNTRLEQAQQKSDALRDEVSQLDEEISRNPPNVEDLRIQREAKNNAYRSAYDAFVTLGNEGAPTGGALIDLTSATPIQINAGAYNKRLQDNINALGSVSNLTPATTPSNETSLGSSEPVSKPMRIAIGGAAGLVLGLITAFLVEAWDDRLRRRDRAERVTGLPVIAEVPVLPKKQRSNTFVSAVDAPRSRAAERYRAVRTTLLFALQDRGGATGPAGSIFATAATSRRTPVVMVTSPNPGEGKTTTTANLAAVFGDSGMRTLVIDCDYRKPSIGKYLAPVPSLAGDPDQTRLDNVWFLPAPRNKNNWGDVLTRLRANVDMWRDNYDIVLLDTPPMLATNDASDLLGVADSVVLVLRAGSTRSGPAEGVANLLGRFRAQVLGIVLNGCTSSEMAYGGYGYGYGYYGSDNGYLSEAIVPRPPVQAQTTGPVAPAPALPPAAAPVAPPAQPQAPAPAPNGNGHTNGNGNGAAAPNGTNGVPGPAVTGPTPIIAPPAPRPAAAPTTPATDPGRTPPHGS